MTVGSENDPPKTERPSAADDTGEQGTDALEALHAPTATHIRVADVVPIDEEPPAEDEPNEIAGEGAVDVEVESAEERATDSEPTDAGAVRTAAPPEEPESTGDEGEESSPGDEGDASDVTHHEGEESDTSELELPELRSLDPEMTVNLTGDFDVTVNLVGDPAAAAEATSAEVQRTHLKGLLEALIFASDKPIKPNELAKAASAQSKQVKELLEELKLDYSSHGIHLDEVAGGWIFRTSAQFAPFVRDLTKQKPVKLTRAQIETLSILAYRQPITRPEIDDVRGVDSGPVLKLLLERDLVRILGKKDEPGRPLLYGTTGEFLEFFGLKSLKDLPTLREFSDLTEESRRVVERELGETLEGTPGVSIDEGTPAGAAPDMARDTLPPAELDAEDGGHSTESPPALAEDLLAAEDAPAESAEVEDLTLGTTTQDEEPAEGEAESDDTPAAAEAADAAASDEGAGEESDDPPKAPALNADDEAEFPDDDDEDFDDDDEDDEGEGEEEEDEDDED